jgi:hypothetical protein
MPASRPETLAQNQCSGLTLTKLTSLPVASAMGRLSSNSQCPILKPCGGGLSWSTCMLRMSKHY